MGKVFFKEEQKFGSMWLYLSMGVIYASTILIFVFALYSQFVLNEPWGDKPISDKGLLFTFLLVMAILIASVYLLFGSKLVVQVTNQSIFISFWPYFRKPKIYLGKDIDRFEIRKYKPIKEYGGWGVKQGKKSIGKAFNVSGNIGLQLYLKNGRKLLIGTQRDGALLRAMKKMMENS